jgi:hypothetical protein
MSFISSEIIDLASELAASGRAGRRDILSAS